MYSKKILIRKAAARALVLTTIASLFTVTAPSARAEPSGYYLQCSMNGWVFSVDDPGQCYDGVVSVKSLRDNSVYYRIDVYKARWNQKQFQTWEQVYDGCTSHWICSAVATAVLAKFIKPLKLLWVWLKKQP
ncbi:hypothetical protein [Nonomuraea basaltis]|uniref:hypothetical protein n=1 Tax=Nonomuraea basaltis TaxID=2495887 RepID=UPI00110C4CD4|nr:hypothetical protein [Nonomuraea basaltis]TMR94812.1 hypothetical protein EJK15_31875 [Nonomuraea basaltis]